MLGMGGLSRAGCLGQEDARAGRWRSGAVPWRAMLRLGRIRGTGEFPIWEVLGMVRCLGGMLGVGMMLRVRAMLRMGAMLRAGECPVWEMLGVGRCFGG